MRQIEGFKGLIEQVVWISTSEICVVSNRGHYIINFETNSNVVRFHIAWTPTFHLDVAAFDLESKTVFALDLSGRLRSLQYDQNLICDTDSMNIVIENGCVSVKYFSDLKMLAVLDCHGIWTLSSDTRIWTFLFKVRTIL